MAPKSEAIEKRRRLSINLLIWTYAGKEYVTLPNDKSQQAIQGG